jgi:hypothetical protein
MTSRTALRATLFSSSTSRKVSEQQCARLRTLFQVGSGAVSAVSNLIIEERLAEFFHFCGELTRVHRTDEVVFGRCKDQGLRLFHVTLQLIVSGDGRKERPLFRDRDRTILRNP